MRAIPVMLIKLQSIKYIYIYIYIYIYTQSEHNYAMLSKYTTYQLRVSANYAMLSCSIQRINYVFRPTMLYYQVGYYVSTINYMFRPLLGHHQIVLNLQSNCTTQSVYPMGDEISFTVVTYGNSINTTVPIFAIHILYSHLYMIS